MFKTIPLLISIFIAHFNYGQSNKEILNETIAKLESLKTIEYNLITHEISKSLNRNRIDSAYCYFDFTSKDSLIQSKYQFNSKYGEFVFNGVNQFSTIEDEEVLLYENKPSKRHVVSLIFMINSIYELRRSLPQLITDEETKFIKQNDTIINSVNCFKFNIITNKQINLGGDLSKLKDENIKTLNYFLCISKNDYLPIQFGLRFAKNNGFRTSTFSNLKVVNPKNKSTWDYNTRPLNYRRSTQQEYFKSMRYNLKSKIGSNALDWNLPLIEGDSIKLSNTKEKLTLLEFFFPYCKGCVQAAPEIDEINRIYEKDGLQTFGIEFTNVSSKMLVDYIKTQEIKIPILYNGKNVSKEYEVNAAPTFFLINSEGTILYASSGFNKDVLIQNIEENLY